MFLREFISTPIVSASARADRIRFMERDVCLTIKVVMFTAFSYILYSPDWFEGTPTVGQIGVETIKGAFLIFLALNIVVGGIVLAMDFLPLMLVEWSVFVVSMMDSLFVALLVVITGGLESTIYWVFLFIILRNAVSIPLVRRQIILNAAVIAFYIFAGFLDQTWQQLDQRYRQFDERFVQVNAQPGVRHTGANMPPAVRLATNRPVSAVANTNSNPSDLAKTGKLRPKRRSMTDFDDPEFGTAALNAINAILDAHTWDRVLMRVLLLALLALSCYGINVLADLHLSSIEEAREFSARQEQLRSTGRLAAEIAHQLKNPLSIINNAAFNLQRSLRDAKPDAVQQLDIIREEIHRSDRIITELMGYARLSEGRVEKLQLHEEIDAAIAQALPNGANYEITVQRDYDRPLPPLLMQRAHLREILVNIFLNSREAMHGKGRVEVMALPGENDSVIITIKDSGPGIPPEQLDRIFEPYFSTKETGTGLGLAIVKHNTELYSGAVRAESELGKGTRFTLQFPSKVLLRSTP